MFGLFFKVSLFCNVSLWFKLHGNEISFSHEKEMYVLSHFHKEA